MRVNRKLYLHSWRAVALCYLVYLLRRIWLRRSLCLAAPSLSLDLCVGNTVLPPVPRLGGSGGPLAISADVAAQRRAL
jgi:hypothetical protein